MDLGPGIRLGVGELHAEAVVHHFREHLEREAFGLRRVGLGRLRRELARLRERIALVPGEVGDGEQPCEIARAAADIVGAVGPALAVDEQLFAARRRGRVHHRAARRDHFHFHGIRVGALRIHVGVQREPGRHEAGERRADLRRAREHGAGLEHAQREGIGRAELHQHRVVARHQVHFHLVLVDGERTRAVFRQHLLAVDPDANAIVAAHGQQRFPGFGTRDLRERVGHRAIARALQVIEAEHIGPALERMPFHARAIGTLLFLAIRRSRGGFAARGAEALGLERARERPSDEPPALEIPVAALPGLAHFVLELGAGWRRLRLTLAKTHSKTAAIGTAIRMSLFNGIPFERHVRQHYEWLDARPQMVAIDRLPAAAAAATTAAARRAAASATRARTRRAGRDEMALLSEDPRSRRNCPCCECSSRGPRTTRARSWAPAR